MIFEPKDFSQVLYFINTKTYKKNFKALLFYLRASRVPFLKTNSFFLTLLQYKLIDSIVTLQDKVTILHKEKHAALEINKDVVALDKALYSNKATLRILHTIADGIAARAFRFNRPLLRTMSESNNVGHLTKNSQDHPKLLKQLLLSFNGVRIVNDITRYLRIGDITHIDSRGRIIIYEAKTDVKTNRTRLINARTIYDDIDKEKRIPNKQRRKLLVAQMAIINKIISVPKKALSLNDKFEENIRVKIIDLPIPIKHHIKLIRKAFQANKNNRMSHVELENGYFVSILWSEKLNAENTKTTLDSFQSLLPDWAKKTDGRIIRCSNYQTYTIEKGEFSRNTLPYSIYPFTSTDCLKLMTGDIYLSVFLNTDILKSKLEAAGWTVKDGDYFEKLHSDKPYAARAGDDNSMFTVRDPVLFALEKQVERGIYITSILLTQVIIAMNSFYSIDFLIDAVDAQLAASTPGQKGFITHNYTKENDIYQ